MVELSKSQELLMFLKDEYIDNGYLYSGSWPYNSLLEKGFTQKDIHELLSKGLIQKRNCEGLAYELSVPKRHQLLSQYSLSSQWFERYGRTFLDSICNEVRCVSLVKQCESDDQKITVDTLKNKGHNKPDKMDISCPFSVGQIIQLEYDLPKQWQYSGYAHKSLCSRGVAVGEFMVTDIICNLLVNPMENMIELQSLSDKFNQIHPDARTMLLFEDVVLKRVKESIFSLEEQIADASSHCVKNHSSFEISKER